MITTSPPDVRPVARLAPPRVRVLRVDDWEHDAATAYLATRADVVLDPVRPDVLLVLTRAVDDAVITDVRAAVDLHAGLARLVVVSEGVDDLPPGARRRLGATRLLARDTVTWSDVLDALHDRVSPKTGPPRAREWHPGHREQRLSAREVEVLRRLADGCTTSEIGVALNYSERTIKNVVTAAVGRLGARNRVQAVAYALRNGHI